MTERPASGLHRRTVLGGIGLGGALAAGNAPSLVMAQASPAEPAPAPVGPPASAAPAAKAVEAVRDPILRISREVWATPELSLAEFKSMEIHLRELEAAGFRTVSRGTSGVPTAFVSEWSQGSGGPIVGYLPEYDALPGLGNAAEPRQAPAARVLPSR